MDVTLVSPFDPHPPTHEGRRAHVGGVERVYAHVASGLSRRGHNVTLLCSTDGPADTAMHEGTRIVRVPRRTTILRAPVTDLAAHLPRDADLVQVAATYPFTTPRVLRRAHQLGMPAVLDFHFEPAPGTGLGRMAAAVYRQLGPRRYRLADAVIVRSFTYGRSAKSLARVPESRWRVVPNGIDVERFRPGSGTPTRDYLLFVGRLVPYKGLDVLLRALFLLRPNIPLVVAGDGPLRERLTQLAQRLEVDARFLGHVPDADLPDLYRNARATILPSVTGQEAFGIALLESMACGTPVVASSLPGVADIARLGGLVAETGDAESLCRAIASLMEGERLPTGDALASRIRDAFSWDSVTDRIVEVYEEVLDRRSGLHGGLRPREVSPLADPVGQPVL